MIEVFLVDDEQRALDTLSNVLTTFFDDVRICGTASNVADGYNGIMYLKPQLVFLDVEMGSESGFQLLEKFEEVNFHVAFVTAHEEFALRAIKFSALDYIIKPASVEDLKTLIEKVKKSPRKNDQDQRVKHMFSNFLTGDKAEHKITLPVLDGFEFVKVDEIMYIRADGSYSQVFLKERGKLTSSKSLKFFEGILEAYGFYRIHNSTVINLKHVKSYRKTARGLLVMEDGEEFSIAKNRKVEFLNLFSVQ